MKETLSGVIERVTFHNPETGFAVLRVQAQGRRGPVVVVGTVPSFVAIIHPSMVWINSVSGKQVMVFPKGERIVPIEVTTVLSGKENRYPFDRYSTDIDLLVTAPATKHGQSLPEEWLDKPADSHPTTPVVGRNGVDRSETVPINENLVATFSGIKFEGTVTERRDIQTNAHHDRNAQSQQCD